MSKQLSLKELKGRLTRTPAEPQNQCGSEEHLILLGVKKGADTYLAVMTLHRNGITLAKVKKRLMHFVHMVLNFDKMLRQINHDLQNADGV